MIMRANQIATIAMTAPTVACMYTARTAVAPTPRPIDPNARITAAAVARAPRRAGTAADGTGCGAGGGAGGTWATGGGAGCTGAGRWTGRSCGWAPYWPVP